MASADESISLAGTTPRDWPKRLAQFPAHIEAAFAPLRAELGEIKRMVQNLTAKGKQHADEPTVDPNASRRR